MHKTRCNSFNCTHCIKNAIALNGVFSLIKQAARKVNKLSLLKHALFSNSERILARRRQMSLKKKNKITSPRSIKKKTSCINFFSLWPLLNIFNKGTFINTNNMFIAGRHAFLLAFILGSTSILLVTGQISGSSSTTTTTTTTVDSDSGLDDFEESGRYTIEGKVYSPELYPFDVNWQKDTSISINDGEFNGFLKEDGSFVISNVPSGSYVVDIVNPDYFYESVSRPEQNSSYQIYLHARVGLLFRFVLRSALVDASEPVN